MKPSGNSWPFLVLDFFTMRSAHLLAWGRMGHSLEGLLSYHQSQLISFFMTTKSWTHTKLDYNACSVYTAVSLPLAHLRWNLFGSAGRNSPWVSSCSSKTHLLNVSGSVTRLTSSNWSSIIYAGQSDTYSQAPPQSGDLECHLKSRE